MPELPEVETIARELRDSDLIGKKIVGVDVFWGRTINPSSAKVFTKHLLHQSFKSISRRGKYLVFELSKNTLLVHLRMTGKFSFGRTKDPIHKHERIRLQLNDGRTIIYEDQRKFGRWTLIQNPSDPFIHIGLEPLSDEYTLQAFKELDLKTLLITRIFSNCHPSSLKLCS